MLKKSSQTDLVVELAVNTFPFGIDQFEGVGAIAIHVAEAIRQSSIAEQERHLKKKNRWYVKTDLFANFAIEYHYPYYYFKKLAAG